MGHAHEHLRALSDRALARAKAAPRLAEVTPLIGRGWLLHYEFGGAGGQVTIEVTPAPGTPRRFNYRYHKPEHADPRRAQQLGRAGLLLCRALARSVPTFELDLPRDQSEAKREYLDLYLLSECDRGCVFCSWTQDRRPRDIEPRRAPRTPVPGESGPRLPVLTDAEHSPHLRFGELAARLRAHADDAANYQVAWSGPDCLASPEFDDGLRLAHELGYRGMSVQSPGTRLLEPGFLDFLSAHAVTEVSLTAHARTPELFDRVGGKPGAHRLFWDAVEQLRARPFTLYFEVPCIADTVDDLPAHLTELAPYAGPITVFFWYPTPDMLHLFPRMGMEFDRALDALARARDHVEAMRVSVDGIPRCVVPPELAAHYGWTYSHTGFFESERLELCSSCSLRSQCPGAAPVYIANHGWPADARPVTGR